MLKYRIPGWLQGLTGSPYKWTWIAVVLWALVIFMGTLLYFKHGLP